MINLLENARNYYKYGKVVHRSPSGTVIRKKLNYPGFFEPKSGHVNTTKTFFNKDGKITHQLERNAYIDENSISTNVIKDTFDVNTGLRTNEPRRSKQYSDNKQAKRIVDYTNLPYDYAFRKLPNGKTEYTIFYPEMTVIDKVNKTVKTTSEHKTYVQ